MRWTYTCLQHIIILRVFSTFQRSLIGYIITCIFIQPIRLIFSKCLWIMLQKLPTPPKLVKHHCAPFFKTYFHKASIWFFGQSPVWSFSRVSLPVTDSVRLRCLRPWMRKNTSPPFSAVTLETNLCWSYWYCNGCHISWKISFPELYKLLKLCS